MIREIIVPTQNAYLLHLPDNLIGKRVEVIAFSTDDIVNDISGQNNDQKKTLEQAILFFKKNSIDFSSLEKWSREDLYD